MDIKKMWVLEWSFQQNAFHISPLSKCIERGLRAYIKPWGSDWIVLGVFPNHDGANRFCDLLEAQYPRPRKKVKKTY